MIFSCIALKEIKIFHLRKVTSSKLALTLLRLWRRAGANLLTQSMLCGLDRVTVHSSGWDKMVTDAFPEAKLHATGLLFLLTNSFPLPVHPQQVTFFVLFMPPAGILSTFLRELASTCNAGQVSHSCDSIASVWSLPQHSEILLFLVVRWERHYSFKSRKRRNPCDISVKPSLRKRAKARLSSSGISEPEKLVNPIWGEKGMLRPENLVTKTSDRKAWMRLVVCVQSVHQTFPEAQRPGLSAGKDHSLLWTCTHITIGDSRSDLNHS